MPRLRLFHKLVGEKLIELKSGGLLVGREGAQVDLALDWDARISRRHARFIAENGKVYVEDLNSKNGTWDGDTRVFGKLPMLDGQWITVGETLFMVVPDEAALRPPPKKQNTLEMMIAAYVAGTDDLLPPPKGAPIEALEPETLPVHPISAPNLAPPTPIPTPAPIMLTPTPTPTPTPTGPTPRIHTPPNVGTRKKPASGLSPVIVANPPTGDNKDVTRVFPRFVAEKKVGVRLGERSDLKTLWTENISKGGLFVRTDNPPPRGTILEVLISTPGGEVALRAEVVHVVDSNGSNSDLSGVGLAFIDVRPEQKRAIHAYVDGVSARLSVDGEPDGPPVEKEKEPIEGTLTRARELISKAEENDLYGALGISAETSPQELASHAQGLRNELTGAIPSATPAQVARLNGAIKLLDRATQLMASPQRRLEYDFRRGETRAEQRIELAKQKMGPPVHELRAAWHKAFPERVEKSMALAKASFELRKGRDLIAAVRSGRQALELDPFHEELRQTVKAWTEMIAPVKKDPL